ncbi:hypothetical protein [Amphibiibacter pelophylacis]|uniref:Uncharacterized protein n=1 Tax=Amphibiibacter pelophylacis TaxID=1799477 RepID=A0ACC6P3D2_9BURK
MKDALLMTLIAAAEMDRPLEQGVTLLVDGFLVSGEIVSFAQYLHHNSAVEGVERFIQQSGGNASPAGAPNFIHLKNARFYTASGQSVPSDDGVYWRGAVEAVSGFSFGVIQLD